MKIGFLAMFGQWRNVLELLKYSWPFFGYDQRQWTESMLAAATTRTGLTEIVRSALRQRTCHTSLRIALCQDGRDKQRNSKHIPKPG